MVGVVCGLALVQSVYAVDVPDTRIEQGLIVTAPTHVRVGDKNIAVTVRTDPAGRSVAFTASPAEVCTVGAVDGALAFLTIGTCTVTATLAGDETYLPKEVRAEIDVDVQLTGRIEGCIFDDLNENGVKDTGEPGIPGLQVQMHTPNGSIVGTDNRTDSEGCYVFSGLDGGTYTEFLVEPEQQVGPNPEDVIDPPFIFDQAGAFNSGAVTLTGNGSVVAGANFGGRRMGRIGGKILNNLRGDGVTSPLDRPQVGWSVTFTPVVSRSSDPSPTETVLYEEKDSGGNTVAWWVADSVRVALLDGKLQRTVTTGSDGTYSFELLESYGAWEGAWLLEESEPVGQNISVARPPKTLLKQFKLGSDLDEEGVSKQPAFKVLKWLDENLNGTRDDGEAGVGNWPFVLAYQKSPGVFVVVDVTRTAEDGVGYLVRPPRSGATASVTDFYIFEAVAGGTLGTGLTFEDPNNLLGGLGGGTSPYGFVYYQVRSSGDEAADERFEDDGIFVKNPLCFGACGGSNGAVGFRALPSEIVDTDKDGVPDVVEKEQGTNKEDATDFLDTDGDGIPDYIERDMGTDPATETPYTDTDKDGFADWVEYIGKTNMTQVADHPLDSDHDNVPDIVEMLQGTNPNDPAQSKDSDKDGYSEYAERMSGSNTRDDESKPGSESAPVVPLPNTPALPPATPSAGGGSSGSFGSFVSFIAPVNGTNGAGGTTNTGAQTGGTVPTAPAVLGESRFKFLYDLRYDSRRDPDVPELHKVLIAANYLRIAKPTGWFGPLTFAAVKQYQAAHNVPPTGFVGVLTRAELNK